MPRAQLILLGRLPLPDKITQRLGVFIRNPHRSQISGTVTAMNIEDASFRDALVGARHFIGYVHVADSNRLAPGWGHIPFDEIFGILGEINYNDWITVEILPE